MTFVTASFLFSAFSDQHVNTLWLIICLWPVPPGGRGVSGGGRGRDCQHHPAEAGDREDLQGGGEERGERTASGDQDGHALLRRAAGRRLQEEL